MNKKFKKTVSSIIIIVIALITIIGLSDFAFLTRPNKAQNQRDINSSMEKVFIKTSDNVQLAADYFTVYKSSYSRPKGWVVFLHMMPATKESWTGFAKKIQELGYESLAIDLRGHGKSQGGPDGFINFGDSQHQKSILDVEAAIEFLKTKGAEADKIALIGASIGANLSLQYISEHSEFQTAILLSPGVDYRGIKTETMIRKLTKDQKIFF
ncbi:alpha/beta fold hydrolase, partial [Candidatus Wolfebacteria bacterium]|nr:alpha/beta fold hydrolase [Candidatus Wolfebacteria bacterium]